MRNLQLHYRPSRVADLDSATAHDPVMILVFERDTVVVPSPSEVTAVDGAPAGPSEAARFAVMDPGDTVSGPELCFPTSALIPPEVLSRMKERDLVMHEIAVWNDTPVCAVGVTSEELENVSAAEGHQREDYRSLHLAISEVEQCLFGRAIQMVDWYNTTRFCSNCGARTSEPEREAVATCPACGYTQYPRIAPAMIVAVVRDGKILLARSPRFRKAFHSVLAGFVEPGESVEDCVHREVSEEVSIRVKNVRYFGSQSWPFPHSLMLGFTADWAGGEIVIDEDEIEHADWYGPDELPAVPSELSIAGRMIARFRANSQ